MVDLLCLQNTLLAYGAKDSVFLMRKHCVPHLGAARGAIVSIASTRALQSEPDTEAYAASKGGVVAHTHALAVSLGSGRPRRAQCGHRLSRPPASSPAKTSSPTAARPAR
jgi:NAD(P)-dependent dehydrogenase (short-subunit alcohol dehydrogenase family)